MRCRDCKMFDECDLPLSICPMKGEQTNEEWFCGLSTEEKAEFLAHHCDCKDCPAIKFCSNDDTCKNRFLKWLKEIHHAN